MPVNPDISLILPAYNEARTIASTMREAIDYFRGRGLRWELIVAADGTDGTREAARQVSGEGGAVRVIGGEERAGKGRGIRLGVELASGDIVGFADADNKVPITEFDKISEALRAGGCDVVIGSRARSDSKIERRQPLYRRWGAQGFKVVMRSVVGLSAISDTQCGFKFFRNAVAKELFSRQQIDGYMFDVEILVLASRLGYRIQEVPVRWRDDGDSRLNLVAGNLRNARDILRIRFLHRRLRAGQVAPEPGATVRLR